MNSSTILGLGIGGIVIGEATGITNISGGGSGGVDIDMPTKGTNSPIPNGGGSMEGIAEVVSSVSNSGPDPATLMAMSNMNSGPSDAVLAMLAQSGNKPAQYVREGQDRGNDMGQWLDENTPGPEDIPGNGDGNNGNNNTNNTNRSKYDSGQTTTTGGAVGKNLYGFGKHVGGKQLATALDENSWLDGNFNDNVNDIKGKVDELNPVNDGLDLDDEGAIADINVAPGDGTFDPTTGKGAQAVKETASNWKGKGLTGREDTNVVDSTQEWDPLDKGLTGDKDTNVFGSIL